MSNENPKDNTSIRQIVYEWLKENDYDGLCNPDAYCGCLLSELMVCGEPNPSGCVCAYCVQQPNEDIENEWDYLMSTNDENRVMEDDD